VVCRFVRVLVQRFRHRRHILLSSDAGACHKPVHYQPEPDRRHSSHVPLPDHSTAGRPETPDAGQLGRRSTLSSLVHQDAALGDAHVFDVQPRLPHVGTLPCRRLPVPAQDMVLAAQGLFPQTR